MSLFTAQERERILAHVTPHGGHRREVVGRTQKGTRQGPRVKTLPRNKQNAHVPSPHLAVKHLVQAAFRIGFAIQKALSFWHLAVRTTD